MEAVTRVQGRSHHIEKKKIVCLFERLQLITDIHVALFRHLLQSFTKWLRTTYR